jgi:hypothetical protein
MVTISKEEASKLAESVDFDEIKTYEQIKHRSLKRNFTTNEKRFKESKSIATRGCSKVI